MRKILVMSPAGQVYDHDCVRWYKPIREELDHYFNTGDAFVHDSSLKLLNYDALDVLPIRKVDEAAIARANEECAYVILRGSNYIHGSMEWENAIPVLEKLKIPVIAFGVGAQAPARGPIQLSEQTKRVLHLIAEKSNSLGVRGAYTAQVLWDIGIKNARVVGCPTAFRRNDPNLRIDLPKLDEIRRVAFTMRREVDASYSPDIDLYIGRQRRMILEMDRRFDMRLMAQGEIEEKRILWGSPEQRAHAETELEAMGWFQGQDDRMRQIYRTRMHMSDVVSENERFVASQQLVLGYRLHGNLLAMANRVPSVYFLYDSRTQEFAETFQIPSYDAYSKKEFVLEEYWNQGLFERFNRAYHARYRDMRLFLQENGIDHKMALRQEKLGEATAVSSASAGGSAVALAA